MTEAEPTQAFQASESARSGIKLVVCIYPGLQVRNFQSNMRVVLNYLLPEPYLFVLELERWRSRG